MPITSSALKALRQAKKRTERNRTVKSRAKSAIDAVKKIPSSDSLSAAFSAIDRAVKNHIFHKNKAARLKSQLSNVLANSGKPKAEVKPGVKPAAGAKAKIVAKTTSKATVKKTSKTKVTAAKKS